MTGPVPRLSDGEGGVTLGPAKRSDDDPSVDVVYVNLRSAAVHDGPQTVAGGAAPGTPEFRLDAAAAVVGVHAGRRIARNRQTDGSVDRAERNRRPAVDTLEAGFQLPVDGGKIGLS